MRVWPRLVVCVATMTATGSALAQGRAGAAPQGDTSQKDGIMPPDAVPKTSGTGNKSTTDSGGYGYEFSDDPLSAGGFGPNDATIRVRPGPVRTTLIRPRITFVPEMLKSVENL